MALRVRLMLNGHSVNVEVPYEPGSVVAFAPYKPGGVVA